MPKIRIKLEYGSAWKSIANDEQEKALFSELSNTRQWQAAAVSESEFLHHLAAVRAKGKGKHINVIGSIVITQKLEVRRNCDTIETITAEY